MITEHIISASTRVAKEGGTFPITVSFEDEDGTAMTPDTLNYSVVDIDGTIINGRDEVAVTSPSSSETIILQGDDLPAYEVDGDYTHLWLVLTGTYTSNIGSGLPFQDQVRFSVEAIKGDGA